MALARGDLRTEARQRLCIALDTADLGRAYRLATATAQSVGWIKIGLQLYTAHGPDAFRPFAQLGQNVFLDLKLHDIPNTVASAITELAGLGASMVNVHASGGSEMVSAAVEAAKGWGRRYGRQPPKVIAVTVLTSIDQKMLERTLGVTEAPLDLVLRLATIARDSGADGVVASPLEAAVLRKEMGQDFLIVTPGIRMADSSLADQRRVATPTYAIESGATLLVVGRPITDAVDPAGAARAMAQEVERALGLT